MRFPFEDMDWIIKNYFKDEDKEVCAPKAKTCHLPNLDLTICTNGKCPCLVGRKLYRHDPLDKGISLDSCTQCACVDGVMDYCKRTCKYGSGQFSSLVQGKNNQFLFIGV